MADLKRLSPRKHRVRMHRLLRAAPASGSPTLTQPHGKGVFAPHTKEALRLRGSQIVSHGRVPTRPPQRATCAFVPQTKSPFVPEPFKLTEPALFVLFLARISVRVAWSRVRVAGSRVRVAWVT